MSAFTTAFDNLVEENTLIEGENGALAHKSSGERGLDLFFRAVRNVPTDDLGKLVDSLITSISTAEEAANVFVLLFLCRDCRGDGCGKGEKHLFDRMFFLIFENYPETILALLPLIPKYGCYSDLLRLLQAIPPLTEIPVSGIPSTANPSNEQKNDTIKKGHKKPFKHIAGKKHRQKNTSSRDAAADLRRLCSKFDAKSPNHYDILRNALVQLYSKQLIEDHQKLAKSAEDLSMKPQLTFAGKYAPRSDKHFSTGPNKWIKKALQVAIFGTDPKASEKYRRLVSSLSAALNVPEVKMSTKRYQDIDFHHVPAQCLKRFRKAFLNEVIGEDICNDEEEITGNRHPTDEDRVLCRQHLEENIRSGKVHGKQLAPHELCATFIKAKHTTRLERELYNQQWKAIRESVQLNISKMNENMTSTNNTTTTATTPKRKIDLGHIVPLSDVSGSMNGTPMEVAIALGILVSEINHPAFRDRVLTFDTKPAWVNLSSCQDLADKVHMLVRAPWGGRTDLLLAFNLIFDVVRSAKLQAEDIPDLLILSDMQFDAAVGSYNSHTTTTLNLVKEKFHHLGMELYGVPLAMPRIIFWNLRGDTNGFPATSDFENVQMLSGFSPSLLKCLLYEGEIKMEEEVVQQEGKEGDPSVVVVTKAQITPLDTYMKALADPAYNAVREALIGINEGLLVNYTFTPPLPPPPVVITKGTANDNMKEKDESQDMDVVDVIDNDFIVVEKEFE
eukprot:gene3711-7377_t